MTDFNTNNNSIVIRNFLDMDSVATVSQYMENCIAQGIYTEKSEHDSQSYVRYADPLIEIILKNSCEQIEQETGLKLYPTYSYSRVYVKGSYLKAHVDRPSCEISVTVNVASVGKPWKFMTKLPGKEPIAYTLEPGDALVYKGLDVLHWRNTPEDTEITAQFMLHYVDQNGPFAEYKFDKRLALGK